MNSDLDHYAVQTELGFFFPYNICVCLFGLSGTSFTLDLIQNLQKKR